MSSIFSKIVSSEIPAFKVAENDNHLAFLDIFPLAKGHVLVIPKNETDYIFDITSDEYLELWKFAQKVAKGMDKVIACERIGVAVIGLEVHSQLMTKSKMFCSCRSDYQNSDPNTRVCPVCSGMPGMLPVLNKKAIELVIETGLSLNCNIATETKFDRKNYHYPDLMKGYQISQFDLPIAQNGTLSIDLPDDSSKTIRIERIHLEEDVAKLLHRETFDGEKYTLLDINRAGVPLMEIVTHPDLRSPEEAHEYLINLHSIIKFIGVSTANMEEGSFRCDANISTRYSGENDYGAKVEIKNVNSFKSVFQALKFEEKRQRKAISNGEKIIQETRGWSDNRGTTVSQRSKETASDYRYFPEPDIPPVRIDAEWIETIRAKTSELPKTKAKKYVDAYSITDYDAQLITTSSEVSRLALRMPFARPWRTTSACRTRDCNRPSAARTSWLPS